MEQIEEIYLRQVTLREALPTQFLKPTDDRAALLEEHLDEVTAIFVTAIFRCEDAPGECERLNALIWLPAAGGIRQCRKRGEAGRVHRALMANP